MPVRPSSSAAPMAVAGARARAVSFACHSLEAHTTKDSGASVAAHLVSAAATSKLSPARSITSSCGVSAPAAVASSRLRHCDSDIESDSPGGGGSHSAHMVKSNLPRPSTDGAASASALRKALACAAHMATMTTGMLTVAAARFVVMPRAAASAWATSVGVKSAVSCSLLCRNLPTIFFDGLLLC